MKTTTGTPRVYVGTYGKYNNGSLGGKWLDLEDYGSSEEFYEACRKLHSDEPDPEFMFQDFEGIPEGLIGESWLSEDVWEWLELDEDDRELLAVYQGHVSQDGTIEEARDAFMARDTSAAAYVEECLDNDGTLAGLPDSIRYHIDFESIAREWQTGDYYFAEEGFEDVWVFSRS